MYNALSWTLNTCARGTQSIIQQCLRRFSYVYNVTNGEMLYTSNPKGSNSTGESQLVKDLIARVEGSIDKYFNVECGNRPPDTGLTFLHRPSEEDIELENDLFQAETGGEGETLFGGIVFSEGNLIHTLFGD